MDLRTTLRFNLTAHSRKVYENLATNSPADPETLARRLGLSRRQVDSAAEDLQVLRLVGPALGREGVLVANPPSQALSPVVSALEAEVSRTSRYADQVRTVLAELNEVYEDSGVGAEKAATPGIDRFGDAVSVRSALEKAMSNCESEILAVQPSTLHTGKYPIAGLPRDLASRTKKLRIRLMYPHAIRYDRASLRYAQELVEMGAQVRTSNIPIRQVFLFDKEVAFLPDAVDARGAIAVHDPSVTVFVREVLEAAWVKGEPLRKPPSSIGERHVLAERAKREILRLLVNGAKDEAIARQLGISLRTCRRHIAELMERVGAESRFQAGWLAAETGWIPDREQTD
ncbi:LuxR C-terminal-related transcriptional regulator [Streptomyces sp. NPDC056672]|uniref:helix-turn-helix transcriptional regulator n=1 Tax=Streptomyces sp. NPDC056672 TaxID=3345906 RepID=UPI0036CA130A